MESIILKGYKDNHKLKSLTPGVVYEVGGSFSYSELSITHTSFDVFCKDDYIKLPTSNMIVDYLMYTNSEYYDMVINGYSFEMNAESEEIFKSVLEKVQLNHPRLYSFLCEGLLCNGSAFSNTTDLNEITEGIIRHIKFFDTKTSPKLKLVSLTTDLVLKNIKMIIKLEELKKYAKSNGIPEPSVILTFLPSVDEIKSIISQREYVDFENKIKHKQLIEVIMGYVDEMLAEKFPSPN